MDSGKHQSAFFFGLVIGAIAGALAALFMAPKSGRQIRHDLKDQAGGVQQLISDATTSMRDRSEGLVGTYVDKMSRMTQRGHEPDGHVAETTPSGETTAASATPDAVPAAHEEAKTEQEPSNG